MMFVKWHMGLGDIIATSAIIHKLAIETGEEIIIPTYTHNEESVKSIFINIPNIKTYRVQHDEEFWKDGKTFALGGYNPIQKLESEDFVQWFYRQAGMTYEQRIKWCPIEEAAKTVPQVTLQGEYDFVHDVASIGTFRIEHKTDRVIFRPGREGSILRYVELLKGATEIHCIDSSFFHLVESIETKAKLFYHTTRPRSTKFNSIKNWNICL